MARGTQAARQLGQRYGTSTLANECTLSEWWVGILEPWERLAAEYWTNLKTMPDIAEEIGFEHRQARRLVEALPVVVWIRAYRGPFQSP